ncbi:porin, partial [Escherichia coli]
MATTQIQWEGANKQVISSQADSLIKISRIWAD